MPAKKTITKTKKEAVKKPTDGLTTAVYDEAGKVIKNISLPKEIFGRKLNSTLISQAMRVYLINEKLGTSSTKTRAEVSGGGKKPWRQKGTGRARIGSIRAPHWRGGGIIFGPKPTKDNLALPKKMKLSALSSALSERLKNKEMILIDQFSFKEPKTKKANEVLNRLPIENKKRLLVILDGKKDEVIRSFRNLETVDTVQALDLNVLNVVKSSGLIFTLGAIKNLESRYGHGSK